VSGNKQLPDNGGGAIRVHPTRFARARVFAPFAAPTPPALRTALRTVIGTDVSPRASERATRFHAGSVVAVRCERPPATEAHGPRGRANPCPRRGIGHETRCTEVVVGPAPRRRRGRRGERKEWAERGRRVREGTDFIGRATQQSRQLTGEIRSQP